MLRWLMSWCVPRQALEFQRGFGNVAETDGRAGNDAGAGLNLRVGFASNGARIPGVDPAAQRLA